MARWGGGDDTRWEADRDRGRWGDPRNGGRFGEERNAGRWRGEDERYATDEGSWRERSSGWRDDDWRSREREGRGEDWRARDRDDWRAGETWRDRDDWRGREGRWEELRPGERRTYPPGRRELLGRGENEGWRDRERYGLFDRDRGERGGFDRDRGERGWFERDRDEGWRASERGGGFGLAGREYGGVMGGPYGTGSPWTGDRDYRGWRDSGAESWRGREDTGRGFGESRDRGEGGMMDRMKEGWRKLTGHGPKGYKRSDERIREDVSERIARSDIDADDVELKVENGEVTLLGTVRSRDDKRRLEDLAEDVFGVDEVHNSLRVNRGTGLQATSTGSHLTQPSGLVGTGQPATGGGPSTGTGTSPQPTQARTGSPSPVEPGKTAH